jgi:hypothetical protein
MSEIFKIVDEWKDHHGGPSDASIARTIGTTEQTFNSWRKKGFKTVPRNREPLKRLAELVGLDYEDVVLQALAVDVGLRDTMPEYTWPEWQQRRREV